MNEFDCTPNTDICDVVMMKFRIDYTQTCFQLDNLHDANDCDGKYGTYIVSLVLKTFYTGETG